MSYVELMWIVWAVLGLILLGLILYRHTIARDEDDRMSLEDANETQHRQQDEMLAKLRRVTSAIRIFGGAEGLMTLAIVAFYVMDAMRQF